MINQYPHCDARALHAPGECAYCDMHPDWQELREVWNIAFTNHQPTEGQTQCPAMAARPETYNIWHGNVAQPHNPEIDAWVKDQDDDMERTPQQSADDGQSLSTVKRLARAVVRLFKSK